MSRTESEPLASFPGGFSYHLRWAQPATRMARLDVFADRVILRPRSGRRGIFTPTWEARYGDLQAIRVIVRPLLRGVRLTRRDGDGITFRPAGEFLQDGMESVVAALRAAGAKVE